MGNDEWSFIKVLPYFRQIENDLDIRDDFHGSTGPIEIRRHERKDEQPVQGAFYAACVAAGFPEDPDVNNPEATGVGTDAQEHHRRRPHEHGADPPESPTDTGST